MRGLGPARYLFVRTDNVVPALKRFGGAGFVAAVALTAVALVRNPEALAQVSWRVFGLKFLLYGMWALLQDALVLSFSLVRLEGALRPRFGPNAGWLACAGISLVFGATHAPNIPVLLISAPAGFVIARLFLTTTNLAAAALCHATLGTVLHQIVRLPCAAAHSILGATSTRAMRFSPG